MRGAICRPLRERGSQIVAADRDDKALAVLAQRLPGRFSVFAPILNMCLGRLRRAASTRWSAATICIGPRLDLLIGLLAPGGVLIYETFARR